jgi:hypothetical protein
MRRILSTSAPVRLVTLGGSILLLLALVAPRAEARIGIPKKVKDTVSKSAEKKASPQAAEEPVVFDEVTLELTEARLADILATCSRIQQVSAGRPALVAKLDKANEERSKHLEKYEGKMQSLRDKRSEVESCREEKIGAIRDRKTQEYSQRALSDPALRDKYMKAAAEYNAAAAKGDSTATQKLYEVMYSEMLPTKEDSAKVAQECGPIPPVSPEEKKMDALDKDAAAIQQQLRDLDEQIAAAQASEKGALTREQWGMAVERIQMFLAQQNSKNAPRGFSEEEIKAMEKRLEDLKKANCWT